MKENVDARRSSQTSNNYNNDYITYETKWKMYFMNRKTSKMINFFFKACTVTLIILIFAIYGYLLAKYEKIEISEFIFNHVFYNVFSILFYTIITIVYSIMLSMLEIAYSSRYCSPYFVALPKFYSSDQCFFYDKINCDEKGFGKLRLFKYLVPLRVTLSFTAK